MEPENEINLHYNSDFHAITTANNMVSAMIDNLIYWGNPLQIDPKKMFGNVVWMLMIALYVHNISKLMLLAKLWQF
ncbi:MAG: formate--tetrahydrofolate ligase [Spiroplasma phoeniceum]|nr:MAG: formate--tetrahydrofolate ligase [Spiroplasma phoeniceum]